MVRKMPPHIVLPNGMWRFVKRNRSSRFKKKYRQAASTALVNAYRGTKSRTTKPKKTSKIRRVRTMARRYGRVRRGFRKAKGNWITPMLYGAAISAIAGDTIKSLPVVNMLPSTIAAPVASAAIGKFLLKKDPVKVGIGAFAYQMLFSGGNILGTSSGGTPSW